AKPWAAAIAQLLGVERRGASVYLPGAAPSLGDRADEATRLEAELADAGPAGARVSDRELARYLEGEGRLVRVGESHAVSPEAYGAARAAAVAECERKGTVELARFRDLLGISRRPAQLLLERLDADGVTRRVGDARVLRRAARRRS
nr:SelB C-terminal domain-containing protein [Actinomycetota bacterium]